MKKLLQILFILFIFVAIIPSQDALADFDDTRSDPPASKGDFAWDSYGAWVYATGSDGIRRSLGYMTIHWGGSIKDSTTANGWLSNDILSAYVSKGGTNGDAFAIEMYFAIAIGYQDSNHNYTHMYCSASPSGTCAYKRNNKPTASQIMSIYGLSPSEAPADGHYVSSNANYPDLFVGAEVQKESIVYLTGDSNKKWGSSSRRCFDERSPFTTSYVNSNLWVYRGVFESIYPEYSRTLFAVAKTKKDPDFFNACSSYVQNGIKYNIPKPISEQIIFDDASKTATANYTAEKLLYLTFIDNLTDSVIKEMTIQSPDNIAIPNGYEFYSIDYEDNCSATYSGGKLTVSVENEAKLDVRIQTRGSLVPVYVKYVAGDTANSIGGAPIAGRALLGQTYNPKSRIIRIQNDHVRFIPSLMR